MTITNAEQAALFLGTWGPQIRRGILGEAIDGCMRAFRIMNSRRDLHAVGAICDAREAVSVLRLGYREAFGVEYTT